MRALLNPVFPTNIGIIHFIGIGGIGMSGIADILKSLGYDVQGSDLSESYVTERLRNNGIKVIISQSAENIAGVSLVVKSTAVKDDNPEIIAAKAAGIPIIKRSEMLAEVMRFKHSISISGTHGKTTTTSLFASIFEEAQLNPTVINGGIIMSKETNAYLGSGDYLIAEADESDGTFIKVPSYIAVITNINPEHLDYYGTFENAKLAYKAFIENLPFYGYGVICHDHPTAFEISQSIDSRVIYSYGIASEHVDIRAINIQGTENGSLYDVILSDRLMHKCKLASNSIKEIVLNIHGVHNVLNSLSAICVALERGISVEDIKAAFAKFSGVKRRFIKTGEVDGIAIFDDYAHHPAEIRATLNTAKSVANKRHGRVIAVMQPHRYSRLHNMMEEYLKAFNDADKIIIADVYAAGEKPIENANSDTLVRSLKSLNLAVQKLDNEKDLANQINVLATSGDVVVFLGAGSITKWAYELPRQLKEIRSN